MSQMSEWRRLPAETGEAWLARLRLAEAGGLTEGERVIFGARVWQATAALALDLAQGLKVEPNQLGSEATVDRTLLSLAKDACRLLSPAARQQLSAWVAAGYPDEPLA